MLVNNYQSYSSSASSVVNDENIISRYFNFIIKLCITLFCICSGKSLTPDGTAKLRNQIIDAPWVTPGQFTQAPSLDCIFSQCYSIKSWLDLRSDHVAIVHCSNGRSRSGILIACLLKYIGAFDHASQAFDFFCSARYVSHCILRCLFT